ncbi:Cell division protein FtsL [Sterolibacterium denitrificans]|uniref:Cell division protein FtsL n=1 Tax=Sterolibacterium denitrificans TaxID=157592 RepID=A0A7Z7HP06_9PROT|nr:cell division protein FtsL [Sterolibacterium denitrificans]SMB21017.1 Cell division protein FtsL [Sterolibacterium denitrificans]
MLRLNLFLLLVTVICAIGTVSANHHARKLVTEIEREQAHMRDLDVEWGQLQLEQSTWASHARIESIARNKLRMKLPEAGQIVTIEAVRPRAAMRRDGEER